MDAIIEAAVKQVPAVVVGIGGVVLVVRYFLAHLRLMQESWTTEAHERTQALRTLGDNCHGFQREMSIKNDECAHRIVEAFDRNTVAFTRNSDALTLTEEVLTRIEQQHLVKP